MKIMYKGDCHRPRSFIEALQRANIDAVGRAHSGISDATNLAKMIVHLIKGGVRFGIANEFYH